MKAFNFKVVDKGWATVFMGKKNMPIDNTADLIGVIIHAIQTNAKPSNLDRKNVSKVLYGDESRGEVLCRPDM